jgi:alkylresorcinol/alkylpyrone synthase
MSNVVTQPEGKPHDAVLSDVTILGVGSAFPPYYYDQDALTEKFISVWGARHRNTARLRALHEHALVGGRHLALPIDEYESLTGFGEANDHWIRVGLDIGAEAVVDAVERAGLELSDIDALYVVSVTGIATPSLDARLMNRLGLPRHTTRVPIFGLGCLAGAAGVARVADYLLAHPDRVAVLLSVELCSLTAQATDLSIANLVATGLFGDGAAAVVVGGSERGAARRDSRLPRIIDSRSVFYPDTERVMGWDISESGFKIVLSADVPAIVGEHLPLDIGDFLAPHGLRTSDITTWICHPGGPKVLEAMAASLDMPHDALEISWRSLRTIGNLSSASVLLVLKETLETRAPAAGCYGLLLAMGPGFCSELVLLQW